MLDPHRRLFRPGRGLAALAVSAMLVGGILFAACHQSSKIQPDDNPTQVSQQICVDGDRCSNDFVAVKMLKPNCSADGGTITWNWQPLTGATNYFLQVTTQPAQHNDIVKSFASATVFNNWLNSTTPQFMTPANKGVRYYAVVNWTGPSKSKFKIDGPVSNVVSIAC